MAAPVLLGITVGLGPQLIGGVYGWGIAIITGLAGITCLAAAWTAHRDGTATNIGYVGGAALLGLGWTLVQALPLPRGLTNLLQPRAVALADEGAQLLGDAAPSWVALSIAPGATWEQVVQGSGLVAAFLAAAIIVSLGHRQRVLSAVGASAGLMAAVALMHLAAGADRVFGIYEPVYTVSSLLAPLVNHNHLSGFLAMGAPLLVGLGLDAKEKPARAGWLSLAVIVGAGALMAVSRGGAASLVVGFLALGLFASFKRNQASGRRGTPLVLIGASFAAAVGLGLYVAAEKLYRDFEGSGIEKLELAARGMDLALDYPFVGVGRGAFSAAFVTRYGEAHRATHPENLVTQWCADWGFVVAGVVLIALAFGIVRASRQARSWAHLGGTAGLVGIFAHDLVDFSLELAGVGVVAAALMGAVATPSRRGSSGRQSSSDQSSSGKHSSSKGLLARMSLHRAAAVVGSLSVLLAIVPGISLDANSVFSLQRSLQADMGAGEHERFRETLFAAVRAHPSEPAFALLGGAEAGQRGDPSALQWLNRAMFLAPGWAGPHLETGRYLLRRGNISQGFLELREAAERGQLQPAARLVCPPLVRYPEAGDMAIRIFGDDELGDRMLDRVASCLPRNSDVGERVDAHLIERGLLSARLRAARRALGRREPAAALELLADAPASEAVLVVRASAHLALGDPSRAVELLADRDGPRSVLIVRARAEALAGQQDAMLATADLLRRQAAGDPTRIASVWVLQGDLLLEMDQNFDALHAFARAHRIDPGSSGLRRTATTAERIGDTRRAYRAWSELCQSTGPGSSACRARDRSLNEVRESQYGGEQLLPTP